LRADGNEAIGLGHAVRILSLAHAIKDLGLLVFASKGIPALLMNQLLELGIEYCHLDFEDYDSEVCFLQARYPSVKFLVIDGYEFTNSYKRLLKTAGFKVVLIDDYSDNGNFVDLIINHSPGKTAHDYPKSIKSKLCLGLDYALLQPDFLSSSRNVTKNKRDFRLFINLGGSDPMNYTIKVLNLLSMTSWIGHVDVVIGPLNIHENLLRQKIASCGFNVSLYSGLTSREMAALLNNASLAICPASSIAIEACSCFVPLLVGWVVENQHNNYRGLVELGLGLGLGPFDQLQPSLLFHEINRLTHDNELRFKMISNQKANLKGNSNLNLRSEFLKLI
jgi:UDP-2,4-diacetamido-2,4,6-trideoxy-beta-L-altropyranose hydrolase